MPVVNMLKPHSAPAMAALPPRDEVVEPICTMRGEAKIVKPQLKMLRPCSPAASPCQLVYFRRCNFHLDKLIDAERS